MLNPFKITKDNIVRKEYSYTQGGVALKFTLRTDTVKELVVFKNLMLAALKEIQDDIAALK